LIFLAEDLPTLQSGEYLELTDLSGLHSGANAIFVNFSFGASGYLSKNRERIHVDFGGQYTYLPNKISLLSSGIALPGIAESVIITSLASFD
jgi:PmbA protein